jgi:CBS domain-containing protein
MKVTDVMTKDVLTLTPDTTWTQAARFMLDHHQSAVLVVDAYGTLIGILCEKDLLRGLFPSYKHFTTTPHAYLDFDQMEADARDVKDRKIEILMDKTPLTTSPDAPVLKVAAMMVALGNHHVPVMNSGKIVGMVSRHDIYRNILEKYFEMK